MDSYNPHDEFDDPIQFENLSKEVFGENQNNRDDNDDDNDSNNELTNLHKSLVVPVPKHGLQKQTQTQKQKQTRKFVHMKLQVVLQRERKLYIQQQLRYLHLSAIYRQHFETHRNSTATISFMDAFNRLPRAYKEIYWLLFPKCTPMLQKHGDDVIFAAAVYDKFNTKQAKDKRAAEIVNVFKSAVLFGFRIVPDCTVVNNEPQQQQNVTKMFTLYELALKEKYYHLVWALYDSQTAFVDELENMYYKYFDITVIHNRGNDRYRNYVRKILVNMVNNVATNVTRRKTRVSKLVLDSDVINNTFTYAGIPTPEHMDANQFQPESAMGDNVDFVDRSLDNESMSARDTLAKWLDMKEHEARRKHEEHLRRALVKVMEQDHDERDKAHVASETSAAAAVAAVAAAVSANKYNNELASRYRLSANEKIKLRNMVTFKQQGSHILTDDSRRTIQNFLTGLKKKHSHEAARAKAAAIWALVQAAATNGPNLVPPPNTFNNAQLVSELRPHELHVAMEFQSDENAQHLTMNLLTMLPEGGKSRQWLTRIANQQNLQLGLSSPVRQPSSHHSIIRNNHSRNSAVTAATKTKTPSVEVEDADFLEAYEALNSSGDEQMDNNTALPSLMRGSILSVSNDKRQDNDENTSTTTHANIVDVVLYSESSSSSSSSPFNERIKLAIAAFQSDAPENIRHQIEMCMGAERELQKCLEYPAPYTLELLRICKHKISLFVKCIQLLKTQAAISTLSVTPTNAEAVAAGKQRVKQWLDNFNTQTSVQTGGNLSVKKLLSLLENVKNDNDEHEMTSTLTIPQTKYQRVAQIMVTLNTIVVTCEKIIATTTNSTAGIGQQRVENIIERATSINKLLSKVLANILSCVSCFVPNDTFKWIRHTQRSTTEYVASTNTAVNNTSSTKRISNTSTYSNNHTNRRSK